MTLLKLALTLTLFSAQMSFAELPAQDRVPELRAQGQLLSIRIVPKDKSAKIYLAGTKAAEVQTGKDAKILSVTLLQKGRPRESLKLSDYGDYYEVQNLPQNKPYELSIKGEVRARQEEVRVKVPSTKP